jgi:hypothetical protein
MLNAQGSIAESQTVQLYVQVAYKLQSKLSLNGVKNNSIVL